MTCAEGRRLLDIYEDKLSNFHAARLRLPDAGDYETRFAELSRARSAYREHVETHGCREPALQIGPDLIEQGLQRQLEEAGAIHREASQTYWRLMQVSQHCGESTDGKLALRQALHVQKQALETYRSALRRFSDYVTRGRIPQDLNE